MNSSSLIRHDAPSDQKVPHRASGENRDDASRLIDADP